MFSAKNPIFGDNCQKRTGKKWLFTAQQCNSVVILNGLLRTKPTLTDKTDASSLRDFVISPSR